MSVSEKGPPTPQLLFMRLFFVLVLIGSATCVFVVLTAPPTLRLSPIESRGTARLMAALLIAAMIAFLMSGAPIIYRIRPLYRALQRASIGKPGEDVPPSEAALRDAFGAPRKIMGVITTTVLTLLLLDALGVVPLSGIMSKRRFAVDLFAVAVTHASVHPINVFWRRALWGWLGRVHPEHFSITPRDSLTRRIVVRVVSPVSIVCTGATAVLLSHLTILHESVNEVAAAAVPRPLYAGLTDSAWIVAAVLIIVFLAIFAAAYAAARVGGLIARDLRRLAAYIETLTADGVTLDDDGAQIFQRGYRTLAAADIAEGLGALSARYAQIGEEEARARQAVEDAQRMRTRFMTFMSHDLRSPLNSILGFAELIERETDGELTPAQRESVQMIRESGAELLRLVTEILDSARLEAGRLQLDRQWTPSVEILTEAVRRVRGGGKGRELNITTELQPGLPPVYVDPERMAQAIVLVLAYLGRFVTGGSIRLRALVAPGKTPQLRVEVIDTRASIGTGDRERIVDALRTARLPSARRAPGLGLGLWLARGLLVQHGGDLWCEPRGDGGTAFCFSVPL